MQIQFGPVRLPSTERQAARQPIYCTASKCPFFIGSVDRPIITQRRMGRAGGRSPDDHKEPLLSFFSSLPLPLSVQVSISIFASLGKWTYRTRRHPNHAAAMKEADNKILQ